jgi:2-polyprenyl-6-methoxyphenol hydroxylase-like FAD-dependent oxidoreductase
VTGPYDAIVVGARCAGSPTAMLLARKGYRVLVVDEATFPSDTISTHLIHPPGVSALEEWGLLDRLLATGCPGIHTYAYDFDPFTISGSPGTDESPLAYAPRRTVLDKLLVDAASEAGAEVREGSRSQISSSRKAASPALVGTERANPPSPSGRGWLLVQTVTTRSWPAP